ncbi:MAG: response regulator [Proteobacteria bacterium]|nr:response regulator [Pseudomonadota bacterium]
MISRHDLLKSRLLIIDDNPANVELLEKTLSAQGYSSVLSITDPRKAEKLYRAYKPHLVLLDINMPYLDGYQVMAQIRHIEGSSYIPVLVLTALQDKQTRLQALSEGAQDFLTKPFDKVETLTRIENMLRIRLLHNEVQEQNILLEKTVRERTLELHDTRLEIIYRLGRAAEYRDNETGEHLVRLSHMCVLLGKLCGKSDLEADLLFNASPMHDIGKIGIPDSILLKPGQLTMEEWKIMQTHTTIGADLLDGHDSELMVLARDIALTHHEKWDGTGYPHNLKGLEIPFESRITGIVDVFDGLTSKRPYKVPYPIESSCTIIADERGKHFDPELTDIFLKNIDEFIEIYHQFSGHKDIDLEVFKLSARDGGEI